MNVAIGTGLALVAIIGACLFVLWYGSAVLIDQLEDRIEVLERNWGEQFGAPVEDEPAAETAWDEALTASGPSQTAAQSWREAFERGEHIKPDEMPTDEFPVAPATVPDGMPLAVQTALLDQRPSPVPRDLSDEFPHPVDSDERKAKNAADIEERLKRFNFSGRDR